MADYRMLNGLFGDDETDPLAKLAPVAPPDFGPPELSKMNPAPPVAAPPPSDPGKLQALLAALKTDFSPEKYKAAQAEAEERKSGLGLRQAIAGIGGAIAGRGPMEAAQAFDQKRKAIDADTTGAFEARKHSLLENAQGMGQIQGIQQQADLADPASAPSKVFQSTIKKLYPGKYTDADLAGMSAANSSLILKPLELDAQIKAKQETARATSEMSRLAKQDRQDRKNSENDNKDALALEGILSKGWTARSGQAGQVQQKINAAEAAEALLEQAKNQPGGLDSRQYEELAQAANRLVAAGGSSARAGVENLIPHTFWGRAQTLQEYLSNSPKDAGFQKFTERLAETIAREKKLAITQKHQFQVESLAAHDRIRKSNPELYNRVLDAHGITPDMIDEKGRYKPPASAGGGFPKQLMKDGHVATVKDEHEEAEAQKEGWQ